MMHKTKERGRRRATQDENREPKDSQTNSIIEHRQQDKMVTPNMPTENSNHVIPSPFNGNGPTPNSTISPKGRASYKAVRRRPLLPNHRESSHSTPQSTLSTSSTLHSTSISLTLPLMWRKSPPPRLPRVQNNPPNSTTPQLHKRLKNASYPTPGSHVSKGMKIGEEKQNGENWGNWMTPLHSECIPSRASVLFLHHTPPTPSVDDARAHGD